MWQQEDLAAEGKAAKPPPDFWQDPPYEAFRHAVSVTMKE